MGRPAISEWEDVFGFSDDPTPGDAEMLGQLARSYRSVADDAGDALPLVTQLENQQVGEGKSMEKLRDKLGDLANQVRKLHSSYDQAAAALDTYVLSLGDQQRIADNALDKGREAKERLESATEAVKAAGADIGRLDGADPPPDDKEARASTRRALDEAHRAQSDAQGHADNAQTDLDAARQLAEDARQVREEDASVAAQKLDDAKDEAVDGYSLWDRIKKAFSLALGIISAVLGVLAMLVPGLQGIGIALTIGSFAAGAAAFGINIAGSVESGEFNVLGIVLSTIGLFLGGAGVIKGVGAMASSVTSAVKVGGASGGISRIGSGFKEFLGEFKKIPESFKTVLPKNISIAANDFKNLPGAMLNGVKGLGSKLDGLKWIGEMRRSPINAVTNILMTSSLKSFTFRFPTPKLPTVSALVGGETRWSRPDVVGTFLGVGGLIYGPAAYTGHTTPPVRDDSYLPGTT